MIQAVSLGPRFVLACREHNQFTRRVRPTKLMANQHTPVKKINFA
jgi:hypothetical protein